jgi:hypothetical protein
VPDVKSAAVVTLIGNVEISGSSAQNHGILLEVVSRWACVISCCCRAAGSLREAAFMP